MEGPKLIPVSYVCIQESKQSLYLFIHVHINRCIIHSLHTAVKISIFNLLHSCIHTFLYISTMQHLMLPPKAYGHRSRDKSPCKAPQREDGNDNCPEQGHLVVLQLHVPALQECLIDKGLDKL